jgi:hypothetical protein
MMLRVHPMKLPAPSCSVTPWASMELSCPASGKPSTPPQLVILVGKARSTFSTASVEIKVRLGCRAVFRWHASPQCFVGFEYSIDEVLKEGMALAPVWH